MESYIKWILIRSGLEEYLNYDILNKTNKKGVILNEMFEQKYIIKRLNYLLNYYNFDDSLCIFCDELDIYDFEKTIKYCGLEKILINENEKLFYYNNYIKFIK
jgi:hypothetical protein